MTGAPPAHVTKGDVAKGAGTALLSRLGAVVEVVSQPAYTWLFGIPAYGLYTVLWAWVNLVENVVDLGMTTALQRVVPQADSETRAHSALKLALAVGVLPSFAVALAASLAAPWLAGFLNVAPADQPKVAAAVALFAWALPLWTFIEVATSSLRARRAFGPEIRLRIVYEQLMRLGFAALLWLAGFRTLGLMTAHLLSLLVTAALSLRLIARFYDWRLFVRAPLDRAVLRDLMATGLSILPANIVRRLFQDLPPVLLNLLVPGTGGAVAAGLYGIARKVSSIPQLVRMAFGYVLAPLASAQAALDRGLIQSIYGFATRLSTALVLPVAAALIILGDETLALFAPEARAALPLLVVLIVARALEAVAGPASAMIEVIGHRRWPAINSAIGLACWIGLAFWLVPAIGALGMGAGVAAGIVVSTYLAVAELRWSDGLRPFAPPYAQALAASLGGVALLAAMGWLSGRYGDLAQTIAVIATLPGAIWLSARFGLSARDRSEMGLLGRWLGAPGA